VAAEGPQLFHVAVPAALDRVDCRSAKRRAVLFEHLDGRDHRVELRVG
jgi:hypothetical protein